MAALLPSMRTRFSKACERLGTSTGAAAASDFADSAGGGAGGRCAASRFASRSSSSTISLRNSPSEVNGRRSMTRKPSSCLWSDKVASSVGVYFLILALGCWFWVAREGGLFDLLVFGQCLIDAL